jgi:hypothetical protein
MDMVFKIYTSPCFQIGKNVIASENANNHLVKRKYLRTQIVRLKTNSKVLPIAPPAPPKEIFPYHSIEAFFELVVSSSNT